MAGGSRLNSRPATAAMSAATLAQLGAPPARAQHAAARHMCSAAAPASRQAAVAATSARLSANGHASVLCARSVRPRALRCGALGAWMEGGGGAHCCCRSRACKALRVVASAAIAPGLGGEVRARPAAPSARSCQRPPSLWPSQLSTSVSLLGAFWKFLRPHTIRGTVLGTSSVRSPLRTRTRRAERAAPGCDPRAVREPGAHRLWPRAAGAPGVARAAVWQRLHRGHQPGADGPPCGWLGCRRKGLLADASTLQIYDISIDKMNKPFLPVASGEMSVQFAWVAVRLPAPKVRGWCLD